MNLKSNAGDLKCASADAGNRAATSHSPSTVSRKPAPTFVIESESAGVSFNFAEMWRGRELLALLTIRDVKVRYKQTLMGAAWVLFQPLMTMVLFTLFFNRFAGLRSGDLPYPLFAYSGLLLWTFFSNAVTSSTNSLLNNTSLLTKVYFPRLFIPAASVGAGLVDLAVASSLLIGLTIYYGIAPGVTVVFLPLFVALAVMLAFGVGAGASALSVRFRDLKHVLPVALQFWMFASPVIYPTSIVPERWKMLLLLNPMTGIIDCFRAALLNKPFDSRAIVSSVAITMVILVASVYIFRRTEDSFADLV